MPQARHLGAGSELSPTNADAGSDNPASKLRSSCDRCTSLKIRCNKQKPSCEKCESSNARCVYSPYRWKGRPSVPSRLAAFSPSPAAILPVESLSSTAPYALQTLPASDEDFFAAIGIPFEDISHEISVDLHAMTPWDSTSPTVVQNSNHGAQLPSPCSDALGNINHRRDNDTPAPPISMPASSDGCTDHRTRLLGHGSANTTRTSLCTFR